MQLKIWHKLLLTAVMFGAAVVGFIVKLPSTFKHSDKEMHTLFYFLAAAFLNVLFSKRNVLIHALIFGLLYAFGVAIEYAQQYSNTLLHSRIHGNADPEDMHANLLGLIYFSAAWFVYVVLFYVYKMFSKKEEPATRELQ